MGDFDYLAPHLPPLRLIRMDYRGRGQSDWTGPATYTVPQEAADAIALLDHLEIPQAAILGTSRGGLIGMLIAATAHVAPALEILDTRIQRTDPVTGKTRIITDTISDEPDWLCAMRGTRRRLIATPADLKCCRAGRRRCRRGACTCR